MIAGVFIIAVGLSVLLLLLGIGDSLVRAHFHWLAIRDELEAMKEQTRQKENNQ